MNTITLTLTDEQLKDLQSGKSITIESPKQVIPKWEPSSWRFNILDNIILTNTILAGFRYDTQAQAEKAAKALRSYARQLAWLAENDDGWVANWNDSSQYKFFIYYYNNCYEVAEENSTRTLGVIHMSKENAEKLCKLLNSGIVEF